MIVMCLMVIRSCLQCISKNYVFRGILQRSSVNKTHQEKCIAVKRDADREGFMYTFSSDGFFGYGEKGDFVPFPVWHFLPIGVIANHRIPNANYMYLGNYVPGSTATIDPLSFFPKSQTLRYLCTSAIVVAAFHAIYFLWRVIGSSLQKQRKAGDLP